MAETHTYDDGQIVVAVSAHDVTVTAFSRGISYQRLDALARKHIGGARLIQSANNWAEPERWITRKEIRTYSNR